MTNLTELFEAIRFGKLEPAVEVTKAAIAEGVNPQQVIDDYMIKAMEDVGGRFEKGEAFVPELLMAARAMKGSLDLLKPLLSGGNDSSSFGTVVIGTVKGDLHDIGKNLVASMLEGCGFNVVNLGTDVSSDKFITAIKEHNAKIVCMSALLTTTMTNMKEIISAIDISGIRSNVKIMVGGAPVTEKFAMEIGADGYSSNANQAVQTAKILVLNTQS